MQNIKTFVSQGKHNPNPSIFRKNIPDSMDKMRSDVYSHDRLTSCIGYSCRCSALSNLRL